jgi:ATPase
MKTIVPDTGVLIDGRITQLVERERVPVKIVIPQAAVAELEHQANAGRETGFTGLTELKRLVQLTEKESRVTLEYAGARPSPAEIDYAKFGEIDSMVRQVAKDYTAVLYTTDKVQSAVAEAEGLKVVYLEPVVEELRLPFEHFFTPDTLSVHLKEGVAPHAKVGRPGEFKFTDLGGKPSTFAELEGMAEQSVEYSRRKPRCFVEIERAGALVMQLGKYRVTYAKPPFSEAAELTIVRPIAKLKLEDYQLSPKLFERLSHHAEGILIAGPPGSGKSTFAASLAEHYSRQHRVVKTLESPRDLQVNPEITQYAPLEGSFELTSDVLLLVRPDYTIYDEVRKPDDFRVFSDLRLAGIGMVGVVHASKPIDAIQRFIGKIDLGIIPSVIDTIVFIERGRVAKVYAMKFTVKMPTGMREADLARPVIEVKDFETDELEFDIYKFADETVVFPVREYKAKGRGGERGGSGRPVNEGRIRGLFDRIFPEYEMELSGDRVTLYLPERLMAKAIGKGGREIQRLEKQLGVRIDVRPR